MSTTPDPAVNDFAEPIDDDGESASIVPELLPDWTYGETVATALADLTDPTWFEAVCAVLNVEPTTRIIDQTLVAKRLAGLLGGNANNDTSAYMLGEAVNTVLNCGLSFEDLRAPCDPESDRVRQPLVDWAYGEADWIVPDNFFWDDTKRARRAIDGIGWSAVTEHDGLGRFIAWCMVTLVEEAVAVIEKRRRRL